VDHIAGTLRDGLKEAGVTRSKLFQNVTRVTVGKHVDPTGFTPIVIA
jgi:hypothetical protein